MDDELKRETAPLEHGGREARAHEAREHETAADELGLPDDPALARRELSRHLRRTAFPADRDALLAEARANEAPEAVLDLLSLLPEGCEFATVYEAWDALGGPLEPGAEEALERRPT